MLLNKRIVLYVEKLWNKFFDHPYGQSAAEVLFTLLVSNLVLFLAVFAHAIDVKVDEWSAGLVLDVMFNGINSTEILSYVLSIIAAPLWIMLYHWRGKRHAPLFGLFLFVQILLILGSSYVFARARSSVEIGNPDFVRGWAIVSFVTAVLVWYLTISYHKYVLLKPKSTAGRKNKVLSDLEGGENEKQAH